MSEVIAIRDSLANARTLKLAHTAAVVVGEVIVSNGQVLVAINAAIADADNIYMYRGRVELPKEASLVVAVGDVLYWDATAEVATKTSTSNTKLGIAIEASAAPDTSVLAMLGENK